MSILDYIGLIVITVVAAGDLLSATHRGVFSAKSRIDQVLTLVDTVVILGVVRLVTPWASVPPLAWIVPVALLAIATALTAYNWNRWPTLRANRPRRRSILWASVHGALIAGVGVVVLVIS